MNWKLETDVNDYVKESFGSLKIKKLEDFNEESGMSEYMKEALKGSSKTENKTGVGKPDFHMEKYKVPIIIENKLGIKKLISETKNGEIKQDSKSIRDYAVNGALYYATQMIESGKYKEVIAVGCAGDNEENVKFKIYYVFGSNIKSVKYMKEYTNLNFTENEKTFNNFYKDAVLTEEEKHEILIKSKKDLSEYAKKLNRLMHNHNITAPQRVLYVSGMLLSMQDIKDKDESLIQRGLIPEDLEGTQTETNRDGVKILNQIKEYLNNKKIKENKKNLMLSSFSEISKDSQRDEKTELDKSVAKLIKGAASSNKQIFTFIYEFVYKQIDAMAGHLDIMGEMYSEFLKYALGDGKEIGIVLTPPYITKMMAQLLDINMNSRVLDLAAGSAGFLISAMEVMIEDAERKYGKDTSIANEKIQEIKKNQLMGVELNAEMFTLAATNMILRGDGSSNIKKGNSFKTPKELYKNFGADRILLNPPFSYEENGMPFIEFGLKNMKKGGLAAIIIQDSAGSGKAEKTNRQILKNNTLVASIKMPTDLFIPMAGVQTSIYIFKAKYPHDYNVPVKFIDFREDGYKRSKRTIIESNNPTQRYKDIIKIYKAGHLAKVDKSILNPEEIYIEDFITENGNDWNFDQHKKIDIKPKLEDFKKTVADYLAWEVQNILKNEGNSLGK